MAALQPLHNPPLLEWTADAHVVLHKGFITHLQCVCGSSQTVEL
jgi:hypothetical protein